MANLKFVNLYDSAATTHLTLIELDFIPAAQNIVNNLLSISSLSLTYGTTTNIVELLNSGLFSLLMTIRRKNADATVNVTTTIENNYKDYIKWDSLNSRFTTTVNYTRLAALNTLG